MLTVLLSNDDGLDTLIDESEAKAACAAVLDSEGIAADAELSLSFVSSDEMRALNAAWRGIDAPTDVLSFSLLEEDDGACAANLARDAADAANPAQDGAVGEEPLELGDVVLAPEVIAQQAGAFGNTPADECRLMLVHGMFHLLGYDHVDEAGAAEMEKRELAVLRKLAVARGDDPQTVKIGPTTRHEND